MVVLAMAAAQSIAQDVQPEAEVVTAADATPVGVAQIVSPNMNEETANAFIAWAKVCLVQPWT